MSKFIKVSNGLVNVDEVIEVQPYVDNIKGLYRVELYMKPRGHERDVKVLYFNDAQEVARFMNRMYEVLDAKDTAVTI